MWVGTLFICTSRTHIQVPIYHSAFRIMRILNISTVQITSDPCGSEDLKNIQNLKKRIIDSKFKERVR